MRLCIPWASFTSGAESSGTSVSLRMLWDEDCRTAGLGKTERPVGWEGNGEPARSTLLLRNHSADALESIEWRCANRQDLSESEGNRRLSRGKTQKSLPPREAVEVSRSSRRWPSRAQEKYSSERD